MLDFIVPITDNEPMNKCDDHPTRPAMYDWTDPNGNVWHMCGTCYADLRADYPTEEEEDR